MITCDVCGAKETLVIEDGIIYCTDCFGTVESRYQAPEILRAQPIERRKKIRGVLSDTSYGLLPEDAY